MVLHKRLDYGSSGYQVPPMPRVPRFARGKRSIRKKVVDDKQISAFDLLATVAGELLSERENSPPPSKISETITKEKQWNGIRVKAEVFDQGSCNESPLGSESVFKRQVGYTLKDECKPELGIKNLIHVEKQMNGNLMDDNVTVVLEDPMDLDVKPPALVSSDSSIEVPISRSGSIPKFEDGMELVDRDDDENSSVCPHPSTKTSKACRPQRIGDRRIRKLLASKFWKVPQTAFKEGELSNTDAEMKHIYRSRKMFYTRQRTQRSSFKRRKLFERCSMSDISNSLKFGGIKTEETDVQANINGANGASSSTSIQKSSYESVDYKVKFSIKSFKVPELFIEIPENATVGSLKRTVMEAVTAILSGGLRVGVLLQGKKVRDDKQTLLQAGISRSEEVQNLGFTLEPNSTQPPPPSLARSEDPNSILPCASTEPIQRNQATVPAIDQEPTQTSVLNGPESDHDSVHSHVDADSSVDKIDNSKALVAVPGTAAAPLPVVPLRKPRRSEVVQRRIRRPFSVAEVEALVQAVEKLGTGRWRDVKIRAFDSAKHRTYVDLKDKWKTLVHTARISPQQRRGEPVPQNLLDRVLEAHAYWSQQQARLQVKPPQADPNCK